MRREDLYAVLFDQQKDFEKQIPTVKRELAVEAIKLRALEMPIIVTGVRRCGKSFLLKLIKDELDLKYNEYLYVNFNDERFINFIVEDYQKIMDFLIENSYKENCVFFLDEIQEVLGWEKWLDRIKNRRNVFITGSNSKLLSSEISTILTGRSINLGLKPFNFREFLQARKISYENWMVDLKQQSTLRGEFGHFLQIGGMPKRVMSGNDIVIKELYENILYRDIIKRYGKLTKQIKEISLFLLSTPASSISLRSISLISKIKNISTVKSILDLFENSFLFFYLNKFDYSVKVQIQNPRKIYCIDNGFLINLGFRMSEDTGRLLENLVAIELKRRNEDIYFYTDKYECDFVLRKSNKIYSAIQVCYELNQKNEEREFNGLKDAMKKFKLKEGLILTNGQENEIKSEGKKIIIKPVWKWLMEKDGKRI